MAYFQFVLVVEAFGAHRVAESVARGCRADLVLVLKQGSQCVLGIVVEAQLARDDDKIYAWPAYIANLRSRHRCPVCLLVVTPEESVARWARRPIELGPGSRCVPWVIGPSNVPVVTELRQAQEDLDLAVLSAITHMRDSNTELAAHVISVVRNAVAAVDEELSKMYLDIIDLPLGHTEEEIENTMNSLGYVYRGEFARRYVAEGKAEGRLEVILKLLARRFGPLPDVIQTRVRGAKDAQLDNVAEQVLTAQTLEEALGSLD